MGCWPFCHHPPPPPPPPPPPSWYTPTGAREFAFKVSFAVSSNKSLSNSCCLLWSAVLISGERTSWFQGWIFRQSQPEARGRTTTAAKQQAGLRASRRAVPPRGASASGGAEWAPPTCDSEPVFRGLSVPVNKWFFMACQPEPPNAKVVKTEDIKFEEKLAHSWATRRRCSVSV